MKEGDQYTSFVFAFVVILAAVGAVHGDSHSCNVKRKEVVTVDFSRFADSGFLDKETAHRISEDKLFHGGVSFKARRNGNPKGVYNDGMLYFSNRDSRRASELGNFPFLKGMLIVSANDNSDANDSPESANAGGEIIANFSQPVNLRSIRFIDVETFENGLKSDVGLFDANDKIIKGVKVPGMSKDGGQKVLTFRDTSIMTKWIRIRLRGSGAIDDVVFERQYCPGNLTFQKAKEIDAPGHAWEATYSPDGTRTLSHGIDSTDVRPVRGSSPPPASLRIPRHFTRDGKFNSDGTRVAVNKIAYVSEDVVPEPFKEVVIWDGITGGEDGILMKFSLDCSELAWSAVDPTLFACLSSEDGSTAIRLCSTVDGSCEDLNIALTSMMFSPDGSRIVGHSSSTGNVTVIAAEGAETGQVVLSWIVSPSAVATEYSPNGQYISTDGRDGVRIWNAEDGSLVRILDVTRVIGISPNVLTWSPDSNFVATGGTRRRILPGRGNLEQILVWDLRLDATDDTEGAVLVSRLEDLRAFDLNWNPANMNEFMARISSRGSDRNFSFLQIWDVTQQ